MRICMFVYNNCTTDSRVRKEAVTLRDAGHDVRVVAVLDRTTRLQEVREGIQITRIDRRPLHYRLLWWYRGRRRLLRLGWTKTKRGARARVLRTRRRARRVLRLADVRRRRRVRAVWRRVGLACGAAAGSPWLVPGPDPGERRRRRWRTGMSRVVRLLVGVVALPVLVTKALVRSPIWLFKAVSHVLYGTLMRFHKPLMFGDWYYRCYRLLRDERFDVVHAHDLNTLPVAVALARRSGARLIYDSHELYPDVSTLSKTESRVWRALERPLIRRADEVITVCASIADELVSRYRIGPPHILLNCPPAPLRAVSDASPALLRQHAGLDPVSDELIVLYQGGFAPYRGLVPLVRAARYLDRGRLVLMGWGLLEVELRRLVAAEGLGDRVTIVGPVDPTVLLSYTAGADVGVIPYEPVGLNNTFTTPNKLFEYLSVGLPVVASHLPELARVVLGSEVGLTFARVEPELIAAQLNRVLGDDELRARMRANAMVARELYTWERQAELLLDLYAAAPGVQRDPLSVP